MNLLIEDEGIKLLSNNDEFFLQYDAGAHMVKNKRIKITNEEAELVKNSPEIMYDIIIRYQDAGDYGEDI